MAWMARPTIALEGRWMWRQRHEESRVSLFHGGSVHGHLEPLSRSGVSWRGPCTAQEQGSFQHTPAVCLYQVLTMFLCALCKSCLEKLCCSLWDGLFCILIPFWSHGAARKILFTKSELMWSLCAWDGHYIPQEMLSCLLNMVWSCQVPKMVQRKPKGSFFYLWHNLCLVSNLVL